MLRILAFWCSLLSWECSTHSRVALVFFRYLTSLVGFLPSHAVIWFGRSAVLRRYWDSQRGSVHKPTHTQANFC